MALSQIIKKECPVCGKVAVEASRLNIGEKTLIVLQCKHVITEDKIAAGLYDSIVSSDGDKLMPYQIAGIKFAEESNARCLIADEQGLGKTVQVLGLLKLHMAELLPVVVVPPTTVKLQWHHEFIRWCGVNGFLCQTIASSKEKAMPAFDVFIVSYDLLKTEGMFDLVNIKTVVIDECQKIKDHLSGRAKAVQKIAKNAEHVIALSGTPIKNHAGEYFTVLNILQPSRFPTYQGYIDNYCDAYYNGYGYKIGGLKNPKAFAELTKDFIIRRTKAEVLPDLPKLSRKFYHVELDRRLNKEYDRLLKELDDLFYSEEADTMAQKIVIMTAMRKLTGISKVEQCTDFVVEHLLSTDRPIVIFAHHHDAITLLEANLNNWLRDGNYPKLLNLHAGLNGDERQKMVERFKAGESRVMIASTLAAGEGLNLQFCSDAVMLERQWNPANEEQAEGRFHRFGQENPVSVTYMLASETIDEYFTEIVERKRAIVASTLDHKEIAWDQNSLMAELAQVLVTKGKKKWTL